MSDSHFEGQPTPRPDGDDYVATYMKGASRVVLRDKIVGRGSLLVLAMMTLWCAGGALATFLGALPKSSVGVGLLLTLAAAFFALLAATLTVVRTVVSEDEVHVQYGLWGPRVPMTRVRTCRVVAYDWKRFGGWGIKRSADGTWAYVMSAKGDVVELTWADDRGMDKTAQFSASDPRAVVAAVEQARATSRGARIVSADARSERHELAVEEASEQGRPSSRDRGRRQS